MGILKTKDIQNFDKYLYKALPQIYRVMDLEEGELTFARLLDAINQGGFVHTNNQIVQVLDMSQIENCPESYLSIFANSLGCDWIEDMPLQYRRKFLNLLITLYQNKGSRTSIEYLARELSGFEVKIIEHKIPEESWEEGDEHKRLFTIKLLAPEIDDPIQSKESEVTINKIISRFIPVHSKCVVLVSYFYDEPHKLDCNYNNVSQITQNLGMLNKVFIDNETPFRDVISYLYRQETNFDMLKFHEDCYGETNDLNHRLLVNFSTTSTRYDVLQHTNISQFFELTAKFKGDTEKIDRISYLYKSSYDIRDNTSFKIINDIKQEHSLETNFDMLKFREDCYGETNDPSHTLLVNFSTTSTRYDVLHHTTVNQDFGTLNYSQKRIGVTKGTQKIKQIHSNTKEVKSNTKFTKNESIVIKYGVEGKKITDLGLNTYVMCTNLTRCATSSKEGRLTNPSYIDKVTQNNITDYIYY